MILAAGAIHSPHLLLLSGVGPKAALEEVKVPVLADRPGVGQNLQDHPAANVAFECDPTKGKAQNVASKNFKLRNFGRDAKVYDLPPKTLAESFGL